MCASIRKAGCSPRWGLSCNAGGYQVKVFNSIDFSKSMHYNPLSYIHNEADILKFVDTPHSQHQRRGQGGRSVLDEGGKLLYCALIAYIIFEAPAEIGTSIPWWI